MSAPEYIDSQPDDSYFEEEVMGISEEVSCPLPDDELLAVLGWLPWRELLRARAVCRRWRRLALHPSLWNRVSLLQHRDLHAGGLEACLRLAPRLRWLSLRVHRGLSADALQILAAPDSLCAVTNLALAFPQADEPRAQRVRESLERFLRRQVALGRLRVLSVEVPHDMVEAVMEVVLLAADLTALSVLITRAAEEVEVSQKLLVAPLDSRRGAASLRCLGFHSDAPNPILEDLLTRHAATLRTVRIGGRPSCRAVKLTLECPQLDEVSLPAVQEAAAGLARTRLSLKRLGLGLHTEETAPELAAYMRTATQLTRLSFTAVVQRQHHKVRGQDIFKPSQGAVHPAAMDLLLELGSSRRSSLEDLHIYHVTDPAVLNGLPRALPGFPLLTTLRLWNVPAEEVLDALGQCAAPSLRALSFRSTNMLSTCWGPDEPPPRPRGCCLPAMFRLVRRRPLLHVQWLSAQHNCPKDWAPAGEVPACSCCDSGLHLDHADTYYCSLYGHSESEGECDLPAHRHGADPCLLHAWVFVPPLPEQGDSRPCAADTGTAVPTLSSG